MGKGTQGMSVV